MSWEDEELEAYEKHRKGTAEANTLASQRNTLLSEQGSAKWTELRTEVSKIVEGINERAGRTVISSGSQTHDQLRLVREDGAKFDGDWTGNDYKAKFYCDQCLPPDKDYELTVRPVDGNDTVVWIPAQGNNYETCTSIAKLLMSNFMRAANLGG
jgi:hypothetical protein